jgi:hypothetical protein
MMKKDRWWIALAGVAFLAGTVFAATNYTVSLDTDENAALTEIVNAINVRLLADGKPEITATEWVDCQARMYILRTRLSPAFTHGRVKAMSSAEMEEVIAGLVGRL